MNDAHSEQAVQELARVEVTAAPERIRAARGVVLVTGATAGIGMVTAVSLARAGFHVIATARHPDRSSDLLAAAPPESLTLMRLDVVDAEVVDAAAAGTARLLREAGVDGLAGLVNNAGAAVIGPAETVTVSQWRQQFEINFFGQIAVTQAFLPLLRAGRGRIVNIGSVAAWITMPFLGPLAASKAAFRALNDALRLELKPSGVRVILLEPARVNSAAPDKLLGDLEQVIAQMPDERRAEYADGFRTMIKKFVSRAKSGVPPQLIGDAVVAAMTQAHPRNRRPLGITAYQFGLIGRLVPSPVLDRVRYRVFGLVGFARGDRRRPDRAASARTT